MITIDKGIPLPKLNPKPTKKHSRPDRAKYPWTKMEIGDSFLTDKKPGMHALAADAGLRYGMKFVVRTNCKGMRVWRFK